MSKLIKVLAVVLGILVLAVLALPFVIDANRFRPLLESTLQEALRRQVTLGDLKLALVSGGVTASDLAIAEDPAFGKDPFLRAKSLHVGVELLPLVFHRRLHVTALTIQQPEVALRQNAAGIWNFSSLGNGQSQGTPKSSDSSASLDLSVSKIEISDGRFSFNKLGLEKVSLVVTDFSPASSFPFKFQAAVVGGGQIALSGKAGPLAADASRIPFDAHLTIEQFNLAGAGFGGQASLDGTAASNGGKVDISGKLKVDRARLVRGGSPSTKTLELDCAVSHDLESRTGTLRQGDIHIGKALASLTGTYDLHAAEPRVHMKVAGSAMPLDELVAMLPALDVRLPAGSSIHGGTATIHVTTEGALDRMTSSGSVAVANANLAGFDLGQKLSTVERLAGIKSGPNTEIQILSANLKAAPEGTNVDDLKLAAQGIGELTGGGRISPSHELAFTMRAVVHTSGVLTTALGAKGDTGIPFTIAGTAENPIFRPDVKGIVQGRLKAAESDPVGAAKAAQGLVRGLLGRTPK